MCYYDNLQSTFQHAVECLVKFLHAGAIFCRCHFQRVSAGRARHTGSFLERRPLARAQLHGSSLGSRRVLRTVEDFQNCLRQTFPHEIRMLDPHSKALPPRSILSIYVCHLVLLQGKARAAKDVQLSPHSLPPLKHTPQCGNGNEHTPQTDILLLILDCQTPSVSPYRKVLAVRISKSQLLVQNVPQDVWLGC